MRTAAVLSLCLVGSLSACDAVKFPGFTPREKVEEPSGPPPPPPLEPVNPIKINGEMIAVPGNLPSAGEQLPRTAPARDDALESLFDGASLANLNTRQCAGPSNTDTNTLAEIMSARRTEPSTLPREITTQSPSRLDSFPGIVKLEPIRQTGTGNIASGHCGATRIANNWFVTAAHCVDQTYDRIEMVVGAADLNSPAARRIAADAALCHGGYTGHTGSYANDIALLHVADDQVEALSETPVSKLGRAALPLTPVTYPIAHMAGWGLTDYQANLSSTLQTAELDVIGSGPAAIVVSSTTSGGPCIGDSGGPLFVTEEDGARSLIGVLSVIEENTATGQFCSGDYRARFTNTAGFVSWANTLMAFCETRFEDCARP